MVEKIQGVVSYLKHAFDTIGNSTSSTIASYAFYQGPGNLCTVRPGKANTENVAAGSHITDVVVWTAFPKDHGYGKFKWPVRVARSAGLCLYFSTLEDTDILLLQFSREDYELNSELFEKLPTRLENGTVKPSNPKVLPGLDVVAEGFQEYRDGKISAYKIVYEL